MEDESTQRQHGEPETVPTAPEEQGAESLAEVIGPEGHTQPERTEAEELLAQRRRGSLQVTREQAAAWQGELELPDDALHPDDVAEREARVQHARAEEEAEQRRQREQQEQHQQHQSEEGA